MSPAGSSARNPLSGRLTEAPMLRSQVYKRLRDAIMSGELAPGTKLSPSQLAKSFGVSTMPVRDAMHLLAEEGLVETAARRWTRVVAPNVSLADELYPLVGVLEEYAVTSGPKPTAKQLAALRRLNRELAKASRARNVAQCVESDNNFHAVLVEANTNKELLKTVQELKARLVLIEGAFFRRDLASASAEQHDEVIEALAGGDLTGAGDAVRRNWAHGLEMIHLAVDHQNGSGEG